MIYKRFLLLNHNTYMHIRTSFVHHWLKYLQSNIPSTIKLSSARRVNQRINSHRITGVEMLLQFGRVLQRKQFLSLLLLRPIGLHIDRNPYYVTCAYSTQFGSVSKLHRLKCTVVVILMNSDAYSNTTVYCLLSSFMRNDHSPAVGVVLTAFFLLRSRVIQSAIAV